MTAFHDTTQRDIQRYPLAWPTGWKRTPAQQRQRARFGRAEVRSGSGGDGIAPRYYGRRDLTVADGIARLTSELRMLGASNEALSTNVQTRLDGLPRSGQREPDDPGAAVYFALRGKPRCLACDRWDRVADNIAAIAAHIDSIRAVDRYGVGTLDQAFAGYAQLPPSAEEWWLVLGVSQTATADDVDRAFKVLARKHHPDVGGSDEQMARINRARVAAMESLSA